MKLNSSCLLCIREASGWVDCGSEITEGKQYSFLLLGLVFNNKCSDLTVIESGPDTIRRLLCIVIFLNVKKLFFKMSLMSLRVCFKDMVIFVFRFSNQNKPYIFVLSRVFNCSWDMILIIIMLLHQLLTIACEAPAKGRKNANTQTLTSLLSFNYGPWHPLHDCFSYLILFFLHVH